MSKDAERAKAYRAANPEKIKEQQRRYRETHRKELSERSRRYRGRHPERAAAVIKRWAAEHPEKTLEYKRRWRQRNKEHVSAYSKGWVSEHPDRALAHQILGNAVARGKFKKQSVCEFCGATTNIDGHHQDYSRPLEVIWLCRSCHQKLHLGIIVNALI